MAGSAGDQLRQVFAQVNADPKFIALGYEDQYVARAQIASKILSRDPGYAGLSDADKQTALERVAMQPPALADKRLEALIGSTVGKAKAGDANSLRAVSDLAAQNATGRSSVLASLASGASAAIGSMARSPGMSALFGPTPGQVQQGPIEGQIGSTLSGMSPLTQKALMVGDDASKLQVYFGTLGQNDERFSGLPKSQKIASTVGNLIDSIPFLVIPGGIAEAAATKGAQAIAMGSRLVMNAGKLVIPA